MRPEETLDKLRKDFKDEGIIYVRVHKCDIEIDADADDSSEDDEDSPLAIPQDIAKENGLTSSTRYVHEVKFLSTADLTSKLYYCRRGHPVEHFHSLESKDCCLGSTQVQNYW